MRLRLAGITGLLHAAIRRHGGGWTGVRSIAVRSFKVARALGMRGLWRRILAARQRQADAPPPVGLVDFPEAAPLEQVRLSIGVMAHIYYADLLDEFAQAFARLPLPATLMISVVDEQARLSAMARLQGLPGITALHVRVVPNRGRDIAPMLLAFREEILALDLLCHVHTKKSVYVGHEQTDWRRYLLDALLGSRQRIAWILGMFQAAPELGMVYPESYRDFPLWGHTWLSNAGWGRQLGALLGVEVDTASYLDYPAGSMFWARSAALRPLFELGLELENFPQEQGQTDGTLQHALERMLGLVVRRQGMLLGIMPADGRHALASEGERNWRAYFDTTVQGKIDYGAINARLVSFDLFDTLLMRPFLEASGGRDYLSWLVEKRFGLTNFATLRTEAEAQARARAGRDVGLGDIYAALGRQAGLQPPVVEQLLQLELSVERNLLCPRQATVDALHKLAHDGRRRLIGVSDMYLTDVQLRQVLPASITQALAHVYVSCQTGWRKDTDDAWRQLPGIEQVAPEHWLHVGDNEHSDVQLPQARGFIHPVHVLRPASLLTVAPGLRSLRPAPAQRQRWQDQLWLGLVANHFAELGDREPQLLAQSRFMEHPETFGYTVLGPLLLDYLTWLARTAQEHGARKLLFLSREGFLLDRLYARLRAAVPALASIEGRYLLASRRGVNTPALETLQDLAAVLASPYTGPFSALLDARLGTQVATAVASALGPAATRQEVYLPDMAQELIARLEPAADAILRVAQQERAAYLAYWAMQVAAADRPIVADIGYAGTIQTQLQRLLGRPLGGAYLAVKAEAAQVETCGGWADARFYDARKAPSPHSPVMQHHLLLELVLTAREGQFSHFETTSAGLKARYRAEPADEARWAILDAVHAGAERFVMDVCAVTGPDTLELSFDNALVQVPLHEVGSGHWQAGAWIDALRVEDRYTGRGQVAMENANNL